MARGRPMAVLEVSDAERRGLESLARRRKTAQALALRAQIVLHCATGLTNTEVATPLSRLTRSGRETKTISTAGLPNPGTTRCVQWPCL